MSREQHISVAREFSTTPGPRSRDEGSYSGQQFLEELLEPRFRKAIESGVKLVIDLDGTEGYATSFLESAFGGLARAFDPDLIARTLSFVSTDDRYVVDEILEYVRDARK